MKDIIYNYCNGSVVYFNNFMEFAMNIDLKNTTITNMHCVDLCRSHAMVTIGTNYYNLFVVMSMIIGILLLSSVLFKEKQIKWLIWVCAIIWIIAAACVAF